MRPEIHNKAKNNARRCVIPVDGIRTLLCGRNKSEAPSRTRVTPPFTPPSLEPRSGRSGSDKREVESKRSTWSGEFIRCSA